MPTTILRTRNGVLDATDRQALADLAQRLQASGAPLLLHLHGGLVDQAQGEAIAARLGGASPDGYGAPPHWEQVYVVWRTGALSTIKTNWTDLFDNDRLYKALLKKLLDFAASKLGVPGSGGSRSAYAALGLTPSDIAARLAARPEADPFADVDLTLETQTPGSRGAVVAPESDGAMAQELMRTLEQDLEFNNAADDLAAALTFDAVGQRSLSPRGDPISGQADFDRLDAGVKAGLLATIPPQAAARAAFTGFEIVKFLVKHAAKIALRVINRFRKKRDHGFYATVVEELVRELYGDIVGAAIWGMMRRDAADHFAAGALGAELTALFPHAASVKVVAHSAGSIWLAELLLYLDGLGATPPIDVALLAPAVRIDHFAQALGKSAARVRALRQFGMRDDLERKDALLGSRLAFIYPSSLLYLVSGAFEERKADAFADAPILGMQRFLTPHADWLKDADQIAAVGVVNAFLAQPDNGVIFSTTTSVPGQSSQSTSHGGFDQDHDTLASVIAFLSP